MMFVRRPAIAKPPAFPSAGPIGFVALWSLALFVTACLILLSLVEGAAERNDAVAKAPRPGFLSRLRRRRVQRSIPGDA